MKAKTLILIPLLSVALLSGCGQPEEIDTGSEFNYTYNSETQTYSFTAYGGDDESITILGEYDDGTNGLHPVTIIETYCLEGNSAVKNVTVEEGVTDIMSDAFTGSSIESITLPASLLNIEMNAFANCRSLSEVTFASNSSITIGDGAFLNCVSLEEFVYPFVINMDLGLYYTSIPANAFSGCTSLRSFTFSDAIIEIGEAAFYNCTSLTNLTGFNTNTTLVSIGARSFYNCTSLTQINFAPNIQTIGAYAFYNCNALTSVTLPVSLGSIGDYAFANNDALNAINLNKNLMHIASTAFLNLTALEAFSIDAENAYFAVRDGMLFSKDLTTLIAVPAGKTSVDFTSLSSNITSIEEYAFYGSKMEEVDLSMLNIEALPTSAFASSSLKNISLPLSLKVIGEYAFYESNLTSLDLSSLSLESVGSYAFANLANLTSLTFAAPSYVGGYAFSGLTASANVTFNCEQSLTSSWSADWNSNCLANISFNA